MPVSKQKNVINVAIALVWIINGIYCKVLDYVPRHQLIVARILGEAHAIALTRIIGILEAGMAIWILSRMKSCWCAIAQILLVAAMNIIEFIVVPDLLLFGRINIIIAAVFILVIYRNEFKTHVSLY
ncbi:DoxX-like family protein [Chitinophaga polysaccharea]|uniref:DoxX-like family protein n=1 Tax=Chitinophaga polysaccharea TaxID=1293035 RepID=UPI00115B8D7A|nr:DoxX-like family protein [Chitinophaga polysaccharea]